MLMKVRRSPQEDLPMLTSLTDPFLSSDMYSHNWRWSVTPHPLRFFLAVPQCLLIAFHGPLLQSLSLLQAPLLLKQNPNSHHVIQLSVSESSFGPFPPQINFLTSSAAPPSGLSLLKSTFSPPPLPILEASHTYRKAMIDNWSCCNVIVL